MEIISKQKVLLNIEKGKINDAISICLDRAKFLMTKTEKNDFKDDYKVLLILSRRMNDIKQSKILGIIEYKEIQLQTNQITENLIDWLNDAEEDFWIKKDKPDFKTREITSIPDLSELVYHPKLEKNERLNIFRFRAECEHDISELVKILREKIVTISRTRGYFPDTVAEITTSINLEEVRDAMRKVIDGHVMIQTVAFKEDYTGERDYELE